MRQLGSINRSSILLHHLGYLLINNSVGDITHIVQANTILIKSDKGNLQSTIERKTASVQCVSTTKFILVGRIDAQKLARMACLVVESAIAYPL
jgi:hypothetical protein